jgi:hypothetical protein
MRNAARADAKGMRLRHDISSAGESIDPAVLAEADAESRMVRLPSVRRRFSYFGQIISAIVFVGLLMVLANAAMYLQAKRGNAWVIMPALIAVMVGTGWIHSVVTHRIRVRRFRVALHKRGVPICVECGYSLRGLRGAVATCPECGAGHALMVSTNEQRPRQEVPR